MKEEKKDKSDIDMPLPIQTLPLSTWICDTLNKYKEGNKCILQFEKVDEDSYVITIRNEHYLVVRNR